jgi:hypothetical protein
MSQIMSSLAEIPELIGFFSYSRKDDELSEGSLSKLRARIYKELRMQLGREFRLWQDTAAISHGTLWENEISQAIAESVFFIPIITPSAVASDHCRFEFESFLKREAELGRKDLIFPILYIRVPALEDESQWRHHDLLRIVGSRQYFDWQRLRFRDISSPESAEKVELFCANIFEALHRNPLAPRRNSIGDRANDTGKLTGPTTIAENAAPQPADERPPETAESALTAEVTEHLAAPEPDLRIIHEYETAAVPENKPATTSWKLKDELGLALAGITSGVLAGATALTLVALLYKASGLNILSSNRDRMVDGIILLAPVLLVITIAVILKRYRSPLGIPGVFAYITITGIALCFTAWCGVTYVELLMASPQRNVGTPGFVFGYFAAGIMLAALFFFRFRAGSNKDRRY